MHATRLLLFVGMARCPAPFPMPLPSPHTPHAPCAGAVPLRGKYCVHIVDFGLCRAYRRLTETADAVVLPGRRAEGSDTPLFSTCRLDPSSLRGILLLSKGDQCVGMRGSMAVSLPLLSPLLPPII